MSEARVKKERIKRQDMPIQDAKERKSNFNEVALGYSEEQALLEASRCLACKKPLCVDGCPVDIDIPAFIKFISEKEYQKAIEKIKEKNNLPAICGRVCPQESQCEKLCIVGKKDKPVAIGRLERFVADWDLEYGSNQVERAVESGKRVAVVGSGPSGLTAAADLAKLGHQVTVMEALHVPGGVLVYGIPEFRLPKSIVQHEIRNIQNLGVEIACNTVVGKISTVDELLDKGYDAVGILHNYVSIGIHAKSPDHVVKFTGIEYDFRFPYIIGVFLHSNGWDFYSNSNIHLIIAHKDTQCFGLLSKPLGTIPAWGGNDNRGIIAATVSPNPFYPTLLNHYFLYHFHGLDRQLGFKIIIYVLQYSNGVFSTHMPYSGRYQF
jgi:hypothetical protein